MFLIFVKIIDINRWKCGNDLIGWQTFEKFDLEMNKCHDVTIIDIYQLKCCLNSFYTVIVYLYNNDIYNTFIIYIYILYMFICLHKSQLCFYHSKIYYDKNSRHDSALSAEEPLTHLVPQ